MVTITPEHEGACDAVMGEHLPMVLPSLFDIDDNNLLQPKAELNQVIPFHGTFDFSARPACPELLVV